MGQLNLRQLRRYARPARPWVLPVVLTLVLLFGVHARAQADQPSPSELQQYLQSNQLNVYEEPADGYPQIFYTYNKQPIQLTNDGYAHLHPISDGQYVAWLAQLNGQTQVFMEDVLSGGAIQLSQVSPNEGLVQHGAQLVWQGWDGHNWQIYFYDGTTVRQLTSGDTSSINAAFNGSKILYATQLAPDSWQAYQYDVSSGQASMLRTGDTVSTAYPRFNDDDTIATDFIPY
ncbi:MAG TPA: hypothetical protein VHB51_04370 [Candidatus Saccharimonadales bacterium]|nr:hypothetical protein [Candidatus Saccharimonadales bacterium]